MTKLFKKFRNDESGAVTVDWVVLCAAIVGLAIVAFQQINAQTTLLYGQTSTDIASQVR